MTREYSPEPGETWDTRIAAGETATGTETGGTNEPVPPRPNRATRRALARANRRKGNRR